MDNRRVPRLLTFLCILSFIGGFISIKSDIDLLRSDKDLYNEEVAFNLNIEGDGDLPTFVQRVSESMIDFWLIQKEKPLLLILTTLSLSIVSVLGVFMMYRLNKKGFILYSVSNLILVIIPFIYYFNNTIGQLIIAFQFFFTAMFIFMYATQLKYMTGQMEEN
jgi:hypothetical protein